MAAGDILTDGDVMLILNTDTATERMDHHDSVVDDDDQSSTSSDPYNRIFRVLSKF